IEVVVDANANPRVEVMLLPPVIDTPESDGLPQISPSLLIKVFDEIVCITPDKADIRPIKICSKKRKIIPNLRKPSLSEIRKILIALPGERPANRRRRSRGVGQLKRTLGYRPKSVLPLTSKNVRYVEI